MISGDPPLYRVRLPLVSVPRSVEANEDAISQHNISGSCASNSAMLPASRPYPVLATGPLADALATLSLA